MSRRLAVIAVFSVVLAGNGLGSAQAAPSRGDTAPANHGQCVSNSPKAEGSGGRSAVAKERNDCGNTARPLRCTENEATPGTVTRDSRADTVTIAGSGPGSAGSSLECETDIPVSGGESTVSFTYDFADPDQKCGAGVPRVFVVIDGMTYNTIDGDPECSQADGTTVTYTIPVSGTVTQVGFVYDRGDLGSVTYSDTRVGGVALNI